MYRDREKTKMEGTRVCNVLFHWLVEGMSCIVMQPAHRKLVYAQRLPEHSNELLLGRFMVYFAIVATEICCGHFLPKVVQSLDAGQKFL